MASAFEDFAEDASSLFGLDAQEAANLLDTLESEGFDYEDDVLADWMPEAFEALTDLWDSYSEYQLDPSFPDDDWLDAGDEWEITADYTD